VGHPMTEFAKWYLQLVKDFWVAAWDFVTDAFINLLELIFQAVASLIALIPVPSFMTGGLGSAMGGISGDVWYFASNFRLGECLAILGAAVVFRLTRKVVTLFQW